MSYLKLCQILNQSETEVFYQEDCDKNVLVNNLSYPATFAVEIIDWESEDEFHKRGKALSFSAVEVTFESPVENIRDAIYMAIEPSFPGVIK